MAKERTIPEIISGKNPEETEKVSLKEKILQIANELRIEKDGKNKFQNYDYFKPDSIMSALNPLFLKHKVFSHFNIEKTETGYKAILTLSNNGDKIEYTMETPTIEIKGANPVQAVGGIMTYTKRYLLMNAFNIADNKDDLDSDEMHGKAKEPEKKETTKIEVLKAVIKSIKDAETLEELINIYNSHTGLQATKEFSIAMSTRKKQILETKKTK